MTIVTLSWSLAQSSRDIVKPRLVKPDVACVLNIGTAHLGSLWRDNIAKTKSEIYHGLSGRRYSMIVPFGDDYFDTHQ